MLNGRHLCICTENRISAKTVEPLCLSPSFDEPRSVRKYPGKGGGVLSYIGYIGLCGAKGYGFIGVLV